MHKFQEIIVLKSNCMLELKLNSETSLEKEELKIVSKKYFEHFGFKNIKTDNDSIKIQRGSELRNAFTFHPLHWKSEIQIAIIQENDTHFVSCHFSINTKHQLVTDHEINLWNELINGYEKLITKNNYNLDDIVAEAKRTKRNNIKIVFVVVASGLISLSLSTLLLMKTGVGIVMILPFPIMIVAFIFSIKHFR